MGLSAGDEQRLRRVSATKTLMIQFPTVWMLTFFQELDYLRGYVNEIEFGGDIASARAAATKNAKEKGSQWNSSTS